MLRALSRLSLLPEGWQRDQAHLRPQSVPFGAGVIRETESTMRKHYDFSKARRNPYAKRLKKQVTIRLDESTLAYFKTLGGRMHMPYQTLINLYLRDCAESQRELRLQWLRP